MERPCCGGVTYHFDGCPEDKPKPCPVYGQPQPKCITSGPAPYFVTGINHVCGRK